MDAREKKTLPQNISTMMDEAWTTYAERKLFAHAKPEDPTTWIHITGSEMRDQVDAVAKGLIARGIKPGDRVGIMARTRVEWSILDFAIWAAGAVSVPVYDTSSEEQVDWITSDSDTRVLVVETSEHLQFAKTVAKGESPVTDILCIDHGAIAELTKAGVGVSDAELLRRKSLAKQDDLATIVYTSGTTGRPKGVRLTHFNYICHVQGLQKHIPEVLFQEGASTVLFLTLAHSLARLVEVVLAASGVALGYCPDTAQLLPMLESYKPTLILGVPRVFEKVYNGAEQNASAGGKGGIFRWAAAQSIAYSMALDDPSGPSKSLAFKHGIANRLVLSKIYAALGGNASWAVSGSAPLGARLGHFFRGLGIVVLEGYGLTETNAASHVNRASLVKMGTVGPPIPGIEVKIANDGEILMRGDSLFEGYHHNPEATADAIRNGWFHSGDIGAEDEDGYLTITGRKKELIVTAGGKNVAPAVLEDRLRAHPLVSQCVVVGDGKPFIGALVTLDQEALPGWLSAHGHPSMTLRAATTYQPVLDELDKAVEAANEAVSRAESIRKIRVLDGDFTVLNGYLTPSMKLKRSKVLADFAGEVETLYIDTRPAS
jgi:long-chain acyl-CoA synthetase